LEECRLADPIRLNDAVANRLETNAGDDVRAAVRAGLNAFNFSRSPVTDVLPIVLAARDVAGNLVGGLGGHPAWLEVALHCDAVDFALDDRRETAVAAGRGEI
jgi:hypothetical protein